MEDCQPDSHYVLSVLKGDPTSFEPLVRRHQQAVANLLRLVAPMRTDIEDLVQETFLMAYKYLTSYDLERPFRPWILKIALNQQHKKRHMAPFLCWAGVEASALSAHVPDVEDHVMALLQGTEVVQAVRQLPSPLREVVALHYGQDLTITEVADVLQIPIGTVKSRLAKALRLLRRRLCIGEMARNSERNGGGRVVKDR